MKYLVYFLTLVLTLSFVPAASVMAAGATVQASLDSNTAPATSLPLSAQLSDLARIDIYAASGDMILQGIQLGADSANGLQNFANIVLYNGTNNAVLGEYPSQQTADNTLIQFPNIIIGDQQTKIFYIRGTLKSSASGVVRVGFKSLVLGNSESVTQTNFPIYGNAMTLPGATPTPTPSISATPTPTPIPSQTPPPTIYIGPPLTSYDLKEGDTISASGTSDPDIYIVNDAGYKRLFLNPAIFNFYGHLGGFANVHNVSAATRDAFPTSGIFRNCETNDAKVYGVETTGEDTGMLHWVNVTGDQAVAQDPNFFAKVFCINNNEFNWYAKGSDYSSVNQIPNYTR